MSYSGQVAGQNRFRKGFGLSSELSLRCKLIIIIHSCIGKRYAKLFEAAKIHVQIMRLTCCLNMAFTWTKPIWALICLHDVTRESVADLTDHFADAFVLENVVRVYDDVTTL